MAGAAAPSAGKYRGKVVRDSGKVSFSVSRTGRTLLKFTIDGVGATCSGGFQLVTVDVPKARITAAGRFSAKSKPVKGADQTVALNGRFRDANAHGRNPEGRPALRLHGEVDRA